MERNASNEGAGRTFLQAWLSRFEDKWKAVKEPCDGLDGPSRKLAEERVRAKLGTLFMREFVPFADAVIHVFGRRRFEDVFDLPRRTGGDQHRYAWWLTGSDYTDVATRRIVLWTACARNPASYDQGPQYPAMLEEWATSVFLCAPQREEPFFARTIHQWLDWVRGLVSKLEMPARELRSPFVTPRSEFRQWQLQQQDGHAIFTRMITEPVLAPCARLVNMNWEFDLVPTDLSVAAVEAWFDVLLKLPTDNPRSGGLLYWWEIWPGASVQDASEIVRDAYRLLRLLAADHGWNVVASRNPVMGRSFAAGEVIEELELVQEILKGRTTEAREWIGCVPQTSTDVYWDKPTENRNQWIYEQARAGIPYMNVVNRLKELAAENEWDPVLTIPGVKRAAVAYSKRHPELPLIPSRKAGRSPKRTSRA